MLIGTNSTRAGTAKIRRYAVQYLYITATLVHKACNNEISDFLRDYTTAENVSLNVYATTNLPVG